MIQHPPHSSHPIVPPAPPASPAPPAPPASPGTFRPRRGLAPAVLACSAAVAGLPVLVSAQDCPRGWTRLVLSPVPPPRFEGGFAGLPPGLVRNFGQGGEAGLLAAGRGPAGSGEGPTLDLLADTWLWRSAATSPAPAWVPHLAPPLSTPLPPGANAGLASEAASGDTIPVYYWSGGIGTGGPTGRVSFFAANQWSESPTSLPSPRFNHASASVANFDGFNSPYLVGGTPGCTPLLSQTLRGVSTAVANYPSQIGVWVAGAAAISDRAFVVPFGDGRAVCGTPMIRDQVARYDRATDNWVFLNWPIPPRANYALASKRRNAFDYELVLFGGDLGNFPSSQGLLGDTWVVDSAALTFTPVAGPGPSPRRARNQMIYDVSRDWFVLFGGHDGTVLGDTWVLSREPVFGVPPAPAHSCATGSATFTTVVGGGGTIQVSWFWRPEGVPSPVQVSEGVNLHPVTLQPAFSAAGSATNSLSLTSLGADSPPGPRVFEARAQNCAATTISPAAAWTLCRADFNCDGNIDPDDLGDMINCYFATPPGGCGQADFNNDGNIDPDDLGDYINIFFGPPC